MSASAPHIFVSSTGQDDNLGDSVLRRAYLRMLRPRAGHLHVLVGANSAGYIDGLNLSESDTLYTSPSEFRRSCFASALKQRTIFAFNTGEMRLDTSYLRTFVGHLPLVLATRIRGGGAIHLGYGVRDGKHSWRRVVRLILRLCSSVSWRDPVSRSVLGLGSVTPDWAFADFDESHVRSLTAPSERANLVVTMRGDRASPDEAWFEAVSEFARQIGLNIVVFSQVRRDNVRAEELAARLHGELNTWPADVGHEQRGEQSATVYAQAAVVISDRLHALIIAAKQGAVPLGLTNASSEKVRRTLAAVGLDQLASSITDRHLPETLEAVCEMVGQSAPLAERLSTARSELEHLLLDAVGPCLMEEAHRDG